MPKGRMDAVQLKDCFRSKEAAVDVVRDVKADIICSSPINQSFIVIEKLT